MRLRKFSRSYLLAFLLTLMMATPSFLQSTLAETVPGDATSPSAQQAEFVDVTFSFFLCPDGYDPTSQDDPAGTCVTPAPMSADATLGAAPDYVVSVDDFTEIETGVYSHSMSVGWPLHFGDFFPEGANASIIEGDGVSGGLITAQAEGGSVTVYGYNQPADIGTVAFTFLACPEGFNPEESQGIEPYVSCDQPIDAPEGANVGDGIGSHDLDTAVRGVDGTYFIHDLQQPVSLTIRDFETQGKDIKISYPAEPWVRDMWTLDTTEPVTYVAVYVWDEIATSTPDDDQAVGGGTVNLTLFGCPEGIDPTGAATGSAGTEYCTDVISPTGEAALTWDSGAVQLDSLQPNPDGSYTISQLPLNTVIVFTNLEPSTRGDWMATGVDDWDNLGQPYVTLTGTDVVDIALYYYDPLTDTNQGGGTIEVTLRGCPDGVDPTDAGSGAAYQCLDEITPTGYAALLWDNGGIDFDELTPDEPGTYTISQLPLHETLTFFELQPSSYDHWTAYGVDGWNIGGQPHIMLTDTNTVYVTFYYYDEPGESAPDDAIGGGTIFLSIRGCPDGIDPTLPGGDPASNCVQAIQPTGDAAISWDDGNLYLADAPRGNHGTYLLENVPANTTIYFTDLQPESWDTWTAIGADGWTSGGIPYVTIGVGESISVGLYYFDE